MSSISPIADRSSRYLPLRRPLHIRLVRKPGYVDPVTGEIVVQDTSWYEFWVIQYSSSIHICQDGSQAQYLEILHWTVPVALFNNFGNCNEVIKIEGEHGAQRPPGTEVSSS